MSEQIIEDGQKRRMPAKELVMRYTLAVISLFFSALGVALTKKGDLGVSPISSTANILSIRFTELSLGTWLIIWNCELILGQILILRKRFQWIQLLQIPLSFVFGWFTDIAMFMVSGINWELYPLRLALTVSGTVVLGFGITLSVIANVIMNSGEAFVKAISDTIHRDFGILKIVFDITCVVIAVALSLIFFGGIFGTREGTVIAALCVGIVVKLFMKLFGKPVDNFLSGRKKQTC